MIDNTLTKLFTLKDIDTEFLLSFYSCSLKSPLSVFSMDFTVSGVSSIRAHREFIRYQIRNNILQTLNVSQMNTRYFLIIPRTFFSPILITEIFNIRWPQHFIDYYSIIKISDKINIQYGLDLPCNVYLTDMATFSIDNFFIFGNLEVANKFDFLNYH